MAALSQIITASYPLVLANARKPHDQWSENAALRLLEKYGFIKRESLGATIECPLDINANSEAATPATETTSVNDVTANTTVLAGASYSIGEVTVPVKWTKLEEAKNSSPSQKVALVKAKLTNGINSHDDLVEQRFFTGSATVLGVDTLIADDGQGTIGGIDASSATYWRNQVGTAYETDGSNIEAIMTTVYNACLKGSGSTMGPKLLLSGAEAHGLFEGTQQGQQRWVDSQDFKVGARALFFKEAPYGFSQYGDDHIYFLNPIAFQMVLSKEFNRNQGDVQELEARNMFSMKIYTAMQNVVANRSRLGVCFSET